MTSHLPITGDKALEKGRSFGKSSNMMIGNTKADKGNTFKGEFLIRRGL